MLTVVPITPQVFVTVCSDTHLVCGKKTNVQNMGEKNQSREGPRENEHRFDAALALLQPRKSREREAGQCGWTHSDVLAAW